MSEIVAPNTGVIGSIPVPILGNIQNLLDFLVQLPLIGSLFKGKTQHVDYDTSLAKQREALAFIDSIYKSLDAKGQHIMFLGAKKYWEEYVQPGFGTWWDGIINKDAQLWSAKGFLLNEESSTMTYGSMPLFYFLRYEDATRVKDTVEERYTSKVKLYILDPVQSYLEVTYGTSLDENLKKFQATGKTAGTSSGMFAGFNLSSPTTILVIVGILIGGFLLWKKK